MKTTKAYSPGHVTGFFVISNNNPDPLLCGSLGSGFSLKNGVITEINTNNDILSPEIYINNQKADKPDVSNEVLNIYKSRYSNPAFDNIKINHNIDLPMGCGFGTSGAGALSLSLAINKHFGTGLSFNEAAQIAHIAEINCRTGLGTVIGECNPYFECRTKAGAPGIGSILNYGNDDNVIAVFIVFGPLSTKKALSNESLKQTINRYGNIALNNIQTNPDINNFISLSHNFTENTSILSNKSLQIFDYLKSQNYKPAMLMFGNGVYIIINKNKYNEFIDKLIDYLNKNEIYFIKDPDNYSFTENKALIFTCAIADSGGHVLNEI